MNAELHALLDGLTDGEHVKVTWTQGKYLFTIEGPVYVDGGLCTCRRVIRWGGGAIEETLTSIEVTRTEEVTATRVDEERLQALLDSLTDGQEVTAEWRDEDGTMTLTGPVRTAAYDVQGVRGYIFEMLRSHESGLHRALHSVTVRRPVVKRWEREGDE